LTANTIEENKMAWNLITEYLPYLLIGCGVGYLLTLGATGGPTSLDRKKEELAFAKEKLKMFGARK
jgi:hypothetical protein